MMIGNRYPQDESATDIVKEQSESLTLEFPFKFYYDMLATEEYIKFNADYFIKAKDKLKNITKEEKALKYHKNINIIGKNFYIDVNGYILFKKLNYNISIYIFRDNNIKLLEYAAGSEVAITNKDSDIKPISGIIVIKSDYAKKYHAYFLSYIHYHEGIIQNN